MKRKKEKINAKQREQTRIQKAQLNVINCRFKLCFTHGAGFCAPN